MVRSRHAYVRSVPSAVSSVHEDSPEFNVSGTLLLIPFASPMIVAVAVGSNSMVPMPLVSWSCKTGASTTRLKKAWKVMARVEQGAEMVLSFPSLLHDGRHRLWGLLYYCTVTVTVTVQCN